MGTRSLTRVNDGGAPIINMYRQFDGYPDGHGKQLFEFLDGMVVVNGYNSSTPKKAANGASCLAAQLVSKFKTEIGGFYLYPVTSTDCGQDYEYVVDVNDGAITVKVSDYRDELFSGDVAAFGVFCSKVDADE